MKTSRKKSEFVLSCTSNGVVINEKYDFRKYAHNPYESWISLPNTPEGKEIGKMIVTSLIEEGEIKDAIEICFNMMYSSIINNRIIDWFLYEWAQNTANYISWMDEYAMEYYDNHIEPFYRLFE